MRACCSVGEREREREGVVAYRFCVVCPRARGTLLGLVLALLAAGFLEAVRGAPAVVGEQHLGARGARARGLGRAGAGRGGGGVGGRGLASHVWLLGEETHLGRGHRRREGPTSPGGIGLYKKRHDDVLYKCISVCTHGLLGTAFQVEID